MSNVPGVFNYRGAWTNQPYAVGDVVLYGGQLYMCTTQVSAAASYVGNNSQSSTTTAGANLSLPSGSLAGDFVLIALANPTGTAAGPTGAAPLSLNVSGANHQGIFSKYLSSTDISNGYIAIPTQPATWAATIHGFRGVFGVDIPSNATIGNTGGSTIGSLLPSGAAFLYDVQTSTDTATNAYTCASLSGVVSKASNTSGTWSTVAAGYELLSSGTSTARAWSASGSPSNKLTSTIPVILFPYGSFTAIGSEPPGTIRTWAGGTIPAGYFLPIGDTVSRAQYASLFAVLGTTWGAGHGSTTFTLPNLASVFLQGGSPGATGGASTHTHTFDDGGHTHTLTNAYAQITVTNTGINANRITQSYTSTLQKPVSGNSGAGAGETLATALGGSTDTTHANGTTASASTLPPYAGVNFLLKF